MGVLVRLSVWSKVQVVCIWSSWFHCIPKHHHLLPHLNPDWFYLSGTSLPRLSWKRGRWTGLVVVVLQCEFLGIMPLAYQPWVVTISWIGCLQRKMPLLCSSSFASNKLSCADSKITVVFNSPTIFYSFIRVQNYARKQKVSCCLTNYCFGLFLLFWQWHILLYVYVSLCFVIRDNVGSSGRTVKVGGKFN